MPTFTSASLILSTLASESPLMASSLFRVVMRSPRRVQMPAPFSFLMSATLIPCAWRPSKSTKKSPRSESPSREAVVAASPAAEAEEMEAEARR